MSCHFTQNGSCVPSFRDQGGGIATIIWPAGSGAKEIVRSASDR